MGTKDSGWKRKLERDDSIYFLFNSAAQKYAALFQLNITTTKENQLIILDQQLKLIETFFERNDYTGSKTSFAGCAHLESGKYLLMPNVTIENKSGRLEMQNPCVFDFVSKLTHTLDKPPLAPKLDPIVASVGNKGYVLSRHSAPDPSFEAYDPNKKEWETLTAPIYIKKNTRWSWGGYAVFQYFIIVCFWTSDNPVLRSVFHSYNTLSGEWKPVSFTTTPIVVHPDNGCTNLSHDDDSPTNDYQDDCDDEGYDVNYHYDDDDYFIWYGEAVVINNFIYAYSGRSQGIVSYSCTREISDECDFLSFDESIYVEACEIRRKWFGIDAIGRSGAVGKIGDDLICMVQTLFSKANVATSQPVHLTIFRALEGGRCCRLKSFELSMPGTELFDLAGISSCFMLPPEVASNMEHGERTPKKRALDKVVGAVSDSEEVMMETRMA